MLEKGDKFRINLPLPNGEVKEVEATVLGGRAVACEDVCDLFFRITYVCYGYGRLFMCTQTEDYDWEYPSGKATGIIFYEDLGPCKLYSEEEYKQ